MIYTCYICLGFRRICGAIGTRAAHRVNRKLELIRITGSITRNGLFDDDGAGVGRQLLIGVVEGNSCRSIGYRNNSGRNVARYSQTVTLNINFFFSNRILAVRQLNRFRLVCIAVLFPFYRYTLYYLFYISDLPNFKDKTGGQYFSRQSIYDLAYSQLALGSLNFSVGVGKCDSGGLPFRYLNLAVSGVARCHYIIAINIRARFCDRIFTNGHVVKGHGACIVVSDYDFL